VSSGWETSTAAVGRDYPALGTEVRERSPC